MESSLHRYLPPVARLLMSAIFLLSAFGKLSDWSGTAGYMAAYGFFAVPFFLAAAIVLELGGGLSLLLGWKARWGALALIVFLIPATLIFHGFWAAPAAEAKMQMINFLKNVSILGGLLMVVANGAGAFSVDARTNKGGQS